MAEPRLASTTPLSPTPLAPPSLGALPRLALATPAEAAAIARAGQAVLGAVAYGGVELDPTSAGVAVPLPVLAGPPLELWLADGPVVRREEAGCVFSESGGVLFATASAPEAGDLEAATTRVYAAMLATCERLGYPHPWRFWNCLPRINDCEIGLERYKRFCRARAEAFATIYGPGFERRLCSSTAVGSHEGEHLVVHLLAGRSAGSHLENPRQVSAYHYPPQYGPRSPSFARATVVHGAPRAASLYVSGTASIVGHETVHEGDVERQLSETVHNLRVLLAADEAGSGPLALKGYVRHTADFERVARGLAEAFPGTPTVLLHADICRADLLLEIEAVAGP